MPPSFDPKQFDDETVWFSDTLLCTTMQSPLTHSACRCTISCLVQISAGPRSVFTPFSTTRVPILIAEKVSVLEKLHLLMLTSLLVSTLATLTTHYNSIIDLYTFALNPDQTYAVYVDRVRNERIFYSYNPCW